MTLAREMRTAVTMVIAMVLITGLAYPLAITGAAQLLFRDKADGSFIERDGVIVGSKYLGQTFTQDRYFIGRYSAATILEDGLIVSGASNLGPTNEALIEGVTDEAGAVTSPGIRGRLAEIAAREGVEPGRIPPDAVYASGSGLDPDISPAYAAVQVARVARARGISEDEVRRLVRQHTTKRQLGLLGEERVNVLELNLALDGTR
jgi:potassium-transporting ATPase KdpC subunit